MPVKRCPESAFHLLHYDRQPATCSLRLRQRAGLALDFADRLGDLVHIFPGAEKHGLREPDGFFAQLVICWAVIAIHPFGELLARIDRAIRTGIDGVFQERFLVQRRISARTGNTLGLKSLKKAAAF